jgi:hypothetical protein
MSAPSTHHRASKEDLSFKAKFAYATPGRPDRAKDAGEGMLISSGIMRPPQDLSRGEVLGHRGGAERWSRQGGLGVAQPAAV